MRTWWSAAGCVMLLAACSTPGGPQPAGEAGAAPGRPTKAPTLVLSARCEEALAAALPEARRMDPAGHDYVALEEGATGPAAEAFRSLTGAQAAARVRALLGGPKPSAPPLRLDYPYDETLFPPEIVAPTLRWHDDTAGADAWLVRFSLEGGAANIYLIGAGARPPPRPIDPAVVSPSNEWRPDADMQRTRALRPVPILWEAIKTCSTGRPAGLSVSGFAAAKGVGLLSTAAITFRTSGDPVGAPIFYRDVPLPFKYAIKHINLIRWRLGDISHPEPPRTVLENMPVCANCHSFSLDGSTLALDVDYANDKGSYAILPIQKQMPLTRDRVITWSDFRKEDGVPTFGLLSQISPDGKRALSTVKDVSLAVPFPDLRISQLFFPIRGILASYDTQTKRFKALKGADDPHWVQSNPSWSPDGEQVIFARTEAVEVAPTVNNKVAILAKEDVGRVLGGKRRLQYDRFTALVDGGRKFRFDLYKVPYNGGEGGESAPIPGASANGKSNYFAKYSPDGRWIVFCQADSFMLLQPDSELYIMPADGSAPPRRMRANQKGALNSWHSWSPNGRWLVFSSKRRGPFTQLWLTHVDAQGRDSPPVVLEQFTPGNRAANIPEFVNIAYGDMVSINEAFADAYNYFRQGFQYWELSDFVLAARFFRKALALEPDHVESLKFLASALERMGQHAESKVLFERVLRLAPEDAEARRMMADALAGQGQGRAAIEHLRAVLKDHPGDLKARRMMGRELLLSGQHVEAAKQLARAVKQAPNDANLRVLQADALLGGGQVKAAIAALEAALAIAPEHPQAATELAWLLATGADAALRDPARAVALGERICKANRFRIPGQLDALAAAYAAAGRYVEAARRARAALALAANDEVLTAAIKARVALYERGAAYYQVR